MVIKVHCAPCAVREVRSLRLNVRPVIVIVTYHSRDVATVTCHSRDVTTVTCHSRYVTTETNHYRVVAAASLASADTELMGRI